MFKNDNDMFKILNFNEIVARNYWIDNLKVEDSNLNKRITELSNMFLHNAEIYPIIFIDGIENLFANTKEAHIDLIDLCPRLLFVISVNSQFDPKAIEGVAVNYISGALSETA